MCAVVVLLASAARRLAWRPQCIRVRMHWGESLTQDSRSATEGACKVRDVDHKAMPLADIADRDVTALQGASRGSGVNVTRQNAA